MRRFRSIDVLGRYVRRLCSESEAQYRAWLAETEAELRNAAPDIELPRPACVTRQRSLDDSVN